MIIFLQVFKSGYTFCVYELMKRYNILRLEITIALDNYNNENNINNPTSV